MDQQTRKLRAHGWRTKLRDPRVRAAIAASVLVVAFATIAIASGRAPDVREIIGASPAPSGSAVITQPSPPLTVELPPSSAPLSPTPVPPEGVHRAAETSVPFSPPPPETPWPTPDPLIWRYEGTVVDEDGRPLEKVCVVIGPRGCRPGSIKTDRHGRYFVDMPQNPTIVYEFTFMLDGHEVVWHRAQPSGPSVFNVVLRRV